MNTRLLVKNFDAFFMLVLLLEYIFLTTFYGLYFPTFNKTGKQQVPNVGTEPGPGWWCSRMLGTGNLPNFFGKYLVPGKWHSGTQTSSRYATNWAILAWIFWCLLKIGPVENQTDVHDLITQISLVLRFQM